METVNGTTLAHLGNTGRLQLLEGKAQAQQVLSGGIPPLRRIAALKVIDDLAGKAAIQQKIARGGRLRGLQLLAVELVCGLIRGDEALARAGLLIARARGTTLVINVVADFLRYRFHCLREGNLLHFHQEAKDIAALAGGKAVIVTALRAHVKGRGLFVLEGAQALERIVSGGLELNVLAHDLF